MALVKEILILIAFSQIIEGTLLTNSLTNLGSLVDVTDDKLDVFTKLIDINTNKYISDDGKLKFPELAEKYGYTCEEFDVTTEDGYILKLFHIPGDKKKVVLLNHGLFDTGDTYIVRTKKSLGFALASLDYDVWFMNCRGNRYSRRHECLNPKIDSKAFFDFTFHDIGIYDIPAVIDFVLQSTGEDALSYVGHSQGTTSMIIMCSEKPEYNKKIKIAALLAPIAYLTEIKGLVALLRDLYEPLKDLLKAFNIREIAGYDLAVAKLIRLVCPMSKQNFLSNKLCIFLLFAVTGFDNKRLEPSYMNTACGHFPAGSSLKSVSHFMQISRSKRFGQFDYEEKNIEIYGTNTPPSYDLSKVTANITLYVCKNDFLSTLKDVAKLRAQLPNVIDYILLEPNKWNHLDYVLANDMDKTINPLVIDQLNKY